MIYAQEEALEARKASLDLNANEFISQMDFVIDFSRNKSIDAQELTDIRTNFVSKLNESLAAKTIDELKTKEKEMKELSKKFKETVKVKLKDYIAELKVELYKYKREDKGRFKEKTAKLNQERRIILGSAYDKKINELKSKIDEDKKAGKNSKINELLLTKFEKEKSKLNETDLSSSASSISINTKNIWPGIKSISSKTFNFIKNAIKSVGGT